MFGNLQFGQNHCATVFQTKFSFKSHKRIEVWDSHIELGAFKIVLVPVAICFELKRSNEKLLIKTAIGIYVPK